MTKLWNNNKNKGILPKSTRRNFETHFIKELEEEFEIITRTITKIVDENKQENTNKISKYITVTAALHPELSMNNLVRSSSIWIYRYPTL